MDYRTLNILNREISADCYKAIEFIINEYLPNQDNYDEECFVPHGGCAFELLVDNNLITDFTKDIDLMHVSNNPDVDVREKLLQLASIMRTRFNVNFIAIILKIIMATSIRLKINLDQYKPTLADWNVIVPENLGVATRVSANGTINVFSIVYDFKGLRIQLVETANKVYKKDDIDLLKYLIMYCVTPQYLINELTMLLPKILHKKDKYQNRLRILTSTYNRNRPKVPIYFYNSKVKIAEYHEDMDPTVFTYLTHDSETFSKK